MRIGKISSKAKRRLYLVSIFVGYLILSVIKLKVVGKYNADGNIVSSQDDPLSAVEFFKTSFTNWRWIMSLIMTLLYIGYGVLICHFGYKDNSITKLVFYVYVILIIVAFALVAIDVIAGEHLFGYNVARAIKDYLIQTPFISLVIIGAQLLFNRKQLFNHTNSIDF